MKKTLSQYVYELSGLFFDKRKVQGLVKRANKDGYNIYYAYHEDGPDTWKYGWSEDNHKQDDTDIKIFEATNLMGKKKATRAFTRAATYTAECAIFVFATLAEILGDDELREWQIAKVKAKAAIYAKADYERAIERNAAFDAWQKLSDENKAEIERLDKEKFEFFGQPGTAKLHDKYKKEKEEKITALGGFRPILAEWHILAVSFATAQEYIEHKQKEAVIRLLESVEIVGM